MIQKLEFWVWTSKQFKWNLNSLFLGKNEKTIILVLCSFHTYGVLKLEPPSHPSLPRVLTIPCYRPEDHCWIRSFTLKWLTPYCLSHCNLETPKGRDNFITISTPSSYSTCPGLNIKWKGRCLVTDSSIKCAWVSHESKALQIHVHNSHRCLCVPWVPGSV